MSMEDYEFNFISVSRLQKWKRVDRSIEVFERFQNVYKNSRYIIVGEGATKKELETYVGSRGLQNSIVFTGGIDALEVNYLMSQSDIFLSHYALSNVGNPLWEAINGIKIGKNFLFAPGVKLISSNHDIKDSLKSIKTSPIVIGNNVWIGTNVVILPSVRIGDNCVIGAGSIVTKSFNNNLIIAGNPAKIIGVNK